MTVKLHSVASYVPVEAIDNLQQAGKFEESEEFIRTKIGAEWLPRKRADEETSDMAVKAVRRLMTKAYLKEVDIHALILVTQNGDGHNLPHTSALVHAKLGLPKSVAVFDLSLGCSGYVYGLQVLKGFMQVSGFRNGILVTADPYSKIVDSSDRNTTLLFGDAATATLLSEDGSWELSNPIMGSDGAGAGNIIVKDGRLCMNGRQVFNFAVTLIPAQIKDLLKREGLEEDDIDSYCMHQGSAGIVEAIAYRMPRVRDRFVTRLSKTGNTVSSSIPLLLEDEIRNSKNKSILISGFGVGLSWATMILRKRK